MAPRSFHVYNLFTSLSLSCARELDSRPYAFLCVRHSMLKGEILSSTCRFFYGLKFCASKGRSNVLVRLSSRRAVYTRSADGMSSENSLSPFLARAPLSSSVRHITIHKGTTTPHQLEHSSGRMEKTKKKKKEEKTNDRSKEKKCHFHFFFFSVGRVPSTVQ